MVIELETSPEIDVPMKTDEVVAVAREVPALAVDREVGPAAVGGPGGAPFLQVAAGDEVGGERASAAGTAGEQQQEREEGAWRWHRELYLTSLSDLGRHGPPGLPLPLNIASRRAGATRDPVPPLPGA